MKKVFKFLHKQYNSAEPETTYVYADHITFMTNSTIHTDSQCSRSFEPGSLECITEEQMLSEIGVIR
jgi:hypothetical protein